MRLSLPTAVLLSLILASCHGYAPQPLDTAGLFESIARARAAPADGTALDLDTVARRLEDHAPAYLARLARFRTLAARARIEGSWPDPELSIGPQWASGTALEGARTTPFANLSLRIPLGARVAAAHDLDKARAECARIDAILTLREEHLALRADWIAALLARDRHALALELTGIATAATGLASRLVEAGSFGAGDVEALRVEAINRDAEALTEQADADASRAVVAARTGLSLEHLGNLPVLAVDLPADPPTNDRLVELAALHRPELIRLRGDYELAERRLRLEVEKQWPDLALNPSFSDEPGEDKDLFSLGIGIHLPLFDRNQKAIAEAEAERDELRTRYAIEVATTLNAIERLTARLRVATARERLATSGLLPSAERAIDLARRSVDAGTGDALHLLESLRTHARARFAVLEAKGSALQAWFALERAVGVPLLDLGGTAWTEVPPAALAEPIDATAARALEPSPPTPRITTEDR